MSSRSASRGVPGNVFEQPEHVGARRSAGRDRGGRRLVAPAGMKGGGAVAEALNRAGEPPTARNRFPDPVESIHPIQMTARLRRFSSSRTFRHSLANNRRVSLASGFACCSARRIGPGRTVRIGPPSRRWRNGGNADHVQPGKQSSGNCPSATAISRSRLVAARMRTSTWTSAGHQAGEFLSQDLQL